MGGKSGPKLATLDRAELLQLTGLLALLWWAMGFGFARWNGFGDGEAAARATACAVVGLWCWLVYLAVIGRSIAASGGAVSGASTPTIFNLPMLMPTREPWPFWEMIANRLVVSALGLALAGLAVRAFRRLWARGGADAGTAGRGRT